MGVVNVEYAILFGVPLTRRAPLLVDAVRLAENRSQHRRIFGRRRRRRRGRRSRRRHRRGRGNRAQRLIASSVAQASGTAPAPPAPSAPPTPPATPVRLPSPTPGSFTLAAGPREGPAPYTFQEAGFNATGSGTTAAPAAFPATILADLAPETPPPVWERRVRGRSTTTADYSPGLRPGSRTSTFQRLSNGILPCGFNGQPGPSGAGGYSPKAAAVRERRRSVDWMDMF
ncbi:unnamed protein product [Miscanthus lutarioriparius]|uniref:Uncharacterized protein n=1 Tax=Miscanthus lutarioriparius TaxID=422564 RepID=A0A811QF35_9POAL|nr:unnamed protein product [Miscanthus lutarioriparius]